MTLAHFVYIPGVLLVGLVLGYVLGGRAVLSARADKEARTDARARARAARKARAADAERGESPSGPS
ncbi:MAG TPA: hypothetical protein VFG69_00895 [Nannocystaceae bacterium]|nr:hypothetical protein [Nannocystaceae bacterium]